MPKGIGVLEKTVEKYDVAIIHPKLISEDTESGSRPGMKERVQAISDNVVVLPAFYFSGFHPDICYVNTAGRKVSSPIGDYHSAICFYAWLAGRDVQATLELFNGKTYEALGYFDIWELEKHALVAKFRQFDWELEEQFLSWSAMSPFMYTANHPKSFAFETS